MSWEVTEEKTGSGRIRTLTNQLYPAWTIETKLTYLTDAERRALMGFIASVKGGYEPFLWHDPEDNHESKAPLAHISGNKYQAVIRWGTYVEPCAYIENPVVYVDGVKQDSSTYTVSDGIITFKNAPASTAVITADYDYWWKVRFADSKFSTEMLFNNINRSDSFKLEVVR